jgi:hypothetical protein
MRTMPHTKAGMWYSTDLPTKPAYELLVHLLGPGEEGPHLYIQRDNRGNLISASTSNSENRTGWATKIDLTPLLDKKWVEIDLARSLQCRQSIKAYRLSEQGLEAISQYELHRLWSRLLQHFVRFMLTRIRKRTRARHSP